MGANGLDDYDPDYIGTYIEPYGYIHESDIRGLIRALEEHGYLVIRGEQV